MIKSLKYFPTEISPCHRLLSVKVSTAFEAALNKLSSRSLRKFKRFDLCVRNEYNFKVTSQKRYGVPDHRHIECLFSSHFQDNNKDYIKTSILTALDEGNPPVAGGFPIPKSSDAKIFSISLCYHEQQLYVITATEKGWVSYIWPRRIFLKDTT